MALLEVKGLKTYFFLDRGVVKAVDDVSYHVDSGEIVALVGESGCGKTVSVYSSMRLVRRPGRILGGEVNYHGKNVLHMSAHELQQWRGSEVAIVFQEPSASFDPVYTIGYQITETLRQHKKVSSAEALKRAVHLLEQVNVPDAASRINNYPFEFSGGMLQRAMIALAMSCEPKVLIADEPTTSLDATTQMQVLELLVDIVKRTGTALILITHNLGLVARYANRVYIMYAGKVVESTTVDEIYRNPMHPYTRGLWASVPRLDRSKTDRIIPLDGVPPDLVHLPSGCAFAPRCKESKQDCFENTPVLIQADGSHLVRCGSC